MLNLINNQRNTKQEHNEITYILTGLANMNNLTSLEVGSGVK